MSELVSSAQLAEMALPILPKSKQGIEHVAKRDGWPFEYIKGQGRGGRLKKFVLSELPEEIQTAVRERQAAQLLAQSQPAVLPSVAKAKRPVAVRRMEQLGLPIDDYAMGLNDKQRDCAHARMALAAEVLRLPPSNWPALMRGVPLMLRAKGVVSVMNAGQKPWLSRCWLRVSGERRMKFWWRLAKFMGGSLGRLASSVQHFVGRVVRSWVRRLRESRFSRVGVSVMYAVVYGAKGRLKDAKSVFRRPLFCAALV